MRSAGAAPLLTYHDLTADVRIELSATTFGNWVDKTTSLLDSLGVEQGERVVLPVLQERPDHWVGLVWAMAAWQFGSPVAAVSRADASGLDAGVVVIGPDEVSEVGHHLTVACSLAPFGQGFAEVPGGVSDYHDVLGEPDIGVVGPAVPDPAYTDAHRALGAREVMAVPASAQRRLLRPHSAWQALSEGLLAPLLGGGSTVLVRGGDPQRWDAVARAERAAPPHPDLSMTNQETR